MTWLPWVLLALLLLCLLAWYLTSSAGRLDRLHHRVETSRAALDAELARRASAAVELSTSGLLDPAAALVVADAATASLDAPPAPAAPQGRELPAAGRAARHEALARAEEERWHLESDLSQALLAALAPEVVAAARAHPDAGQRLERLLDGVRRVELARRFHNDAVTQARRLRAEPVVRWAHLAGRARPPRTADFDDGAAQLRAVVGAVAQVADEGHRQPPAGS